MGCGHSFLSAWTEWEKRFPITAEFNGAGCLWINDTHMLAAIHRRQSRSHRPKKIIGFGGKRKPDEAWRDTAFRATIEEMLDVRDVPPKLLQALRSCIAPIDVLQQKSTSYMTLVFSFEDLKLFLKICRLHVGTSAYTCFPRTADDLVFHRLKQSEQSEIAHIVYWPRFFHGSDYRVSSDLLHDLNQSKKVAV